MMTFALTSRRRYRMKFFGGLVLQVEEVVKLAGDTPGVATRVIWRDARTNDLSDKERASMVPEGRRNDAERAVLPRKR